VIWLTGLSGSGKSTIANKLNKLLFDKKIYSVILDGDNTRLGINKDLSFSEADRSENIRRVAEIAKLYVENSQIVIASFISPYKKDRLIAKNIISSNDFIEVYVNCTIDECEKRDVKGLYKKARNGEITDFTGISSPYEAPKSADIEIDTELNDVSSSVTLIFNYLINKKCLNID
jgi:adenylylsulfate kinase